MNTRSWLGVLVLLLEACAVGSPLPDGGRVRSPKITIPRDAVPSLLGGVPIPIVEDQLLSKIGPASNATVEFQYEWQRAPSMMMMMSLNQSIVANADSVLQNFAPELSPLERDIAVCGTVNNRGDAPVPTAARYEGPHVEWANFRLELLRVAGSVDALSVIPDGADGGSVFSVAPNGETSSFDLLLGVSNLRMGFAVSGQEYALSIGSLRVACKGTVRPESLVNVEPEFASCGEHVVHCS